MRTVAAVCGAALILALLLGLPLRAQEEASPPTEGNVAFTVGGIRLDVRADTVEEAREAAFREAPRRAWPILWARMTGAEASSAPELPDSALDAMMAGIEVERERFANGRYIASLGVVFDRQRAGRRLPRAAQVLQSRPMLVLPLLTDAATRTIFEDESVWKQAWDRFGTDASIIDYVRAPGNAADAILLNAWQAQRDDRDLWRSILGRYGADNVLTAEAILERAYPGGPITGRFIGRYGPDARVLTRFGLRVGGPGELQAMLDQAIRRLDTAYARALQSGVIRADPSLASELGPIEAPAPEIETGSFAAVRAVTVNVVAPDPGDWMSMEALIRSAPQVENVVAGAPDGAGPALVRIHYTGDYEALRYALDQRGIRVEPGEAGLRLRRRVEGEPPLPPPADRTPQFSVDIPILQAPPPPGADEAALPEPAGQPTDGVQP